MILPLLACTSSAPEAAPAPPPAPAGPWTGLAEGLSLGVFDLPAPTIVGDGKLYAVRIDPAHFDLRLGMATRDGESKTLPDWAAQVPADRAVVAINPSMFQDDWVRSVGLMVEGDHVNHDGLAPDHNSLLVADPVDAARPRARLANLGCEDLAAARSGYRLLVQSIRMLGCDGENVWSQQPKLWSVSLIGQDAAGQLLFMHVRSPYTMHDLVNQLTALPLSLTALHYTDGGPPATLYLRTPEQELLRVGSYETGINEDDSNAHPWELPNALLAVQR